MRNLITPKVIQEKGDIAAALRKVCPRSIKTALYGGLGCAFTASRGILAVETAALNQSCAQQCDQADTTTHRLFTE
jgi:hypothetical protein